MSGAFLALILAAGEPAAANPPVTAASVTEAPVTASPVTEAPVTAVPVAADAPGDWPRIARDTAEVAAAGRWSTGIFAPTRIALTDGFELELHPLLFFVAPNAVGRFAFRTQPVRITFEVGLLVPTYGMRLLKGYLFPSWATSANDIGWMVIPRVGMLISGKGHQDAVWTLRADYAWRILLTRNSAAPLESFLAPLELLMAAPLTGFLGGFGGAYDAAVGRRLRVRAALNLYITGAAHGELFVDGVSVGPLAPRDPIIVTAQLGVDLAVFKHSRVTLGVLWANYDQGATLVTKDKDGFTDRVRVRSNNFLPTLDFIWGGGLGD